jgi:hypothetical protein
METALIPTRCRRTDGRFVIRFEGRGNWTAVGTERREPDGASDGPTASQASGFSGGTDVSNKSPLSGGDDGGDQSWVSDGADGPETTISGPFEFAPEYQGCPECGDGSFFHCGDCDSLLCWDGETDPVQCPWCGQTCYDEGDVGSLDGAKDGGGTGGDRGGDGLTRR